MPVGVSRERTPPAADGSILHCRGGACALFRFGASAHSNCAFSIRTDVFGARLLKGYVPREAGKDPYRDRHPASQDELLRFRPSLARRTRSESSDFARFNVARLLALRLRPARLMKKVSIRMPEPGPFGETRLEAKVRAIVAASLLNSPAGG